MRGLLLKDIALMKTQGRSVLIILAIAIFMLLAGNNTTFVIVYANTIFVMLGITTLSYDTNDNGYAFLFTLPITRKMYVAEKYVFSLVSVAIGVAFSFVLMFGMSFLKSDYVLDTSEAFTVIGYIIGAILFLSVMLPINFKFGPEKGWIALFTVFAIIMTGALVLMKVVYRIDWTTLYAKLSDVKPAVAMGTLGVIAVIALGASCMISCKIMMRKEF